MSLPVRYRPIDCQNCPCVSRRISHGADFLVAARKGYGCLNEIVLTRAELENVAVATVLQQVVKAVCDGIGRICGLAIGGIRSGSKVKICVAGK